VEGKLVLKGWPARRIRNGDPVGVDGIIVSNAVVASWMPGQSSSSHWLMCKKYKSKIKVMMDGGTSGPDVARA
jgi:isopentenyl diphosphate isomerase/L-lactate dehydrogenase-like FMN-dependent dehydrogenase